MTSQNRKDLYTISDYYGNKAQCVVAIEEMSELTKILCKYQRDKQISFNDLVEEVTDVLIMIEQIKIMFGIRHSYIQSIIDNKIERQLKRMSEDK